MQVYEQITPQEHEEQVQNTVHKPIRRGGCPILLLQAVVCLIILLFALILQQFLPELYTDLRTKYDAAMERSILITDDEISGS